MRARQVILVLMAVLWAALAGAAAIPLDHAPVRGPADAPVTIIEFMDFQ